MAKEAERYVVGVPNTIASEKSVLQERGFGHLYHVLGSTPCHRMG